MNDRRKYWTITPKGSKKPIRLVKLSADYTPEGIRRRLVNNRYDRPQRIDYRDNRPKQYKLPTCDDRILQRTSGIYRIYLYYAFRLGVIHSYRLPDPAKLHWIFKEELAYLDRLSEEVRLMGREKISTDVELFAYKHKLEDKIQTFTDERAVTMNVYCDVFEKFEAAHLNAVDEYMKLNNIGLGKSETKVA